MRIPGGRWEEIPPTVARRFHIDSGPQVTYGVCPDCFAKVTAPGESSGTIESRARNRRVEFVRDCAAR